MTNKQLTKVIGGACPRGKIFKVGLSSIIAISTCGLPVVVWEVYKRTVCKQRCERLKKDSEELLDYYLGSPGYYVLPKGTIPILLPGTGQEYILFRGE
jgi:hypothetical protein